MSNLVNVASPCFGKPNEIAFKLNIRYKIFEYFSNFWIKKQYLTNAWLQTCLYWLSQCYKIYLFIVIFK